MEQDGTGVVAEEIGDLVEGLAGVEPPGSRRVASGVGVRGPLDPRGFRGTPAAPASRRVALKLHGRLPVDDGDGLTVLRRPGALLPPDAALSAAPSPWPPPPEPKGLAAPWQHHGFPT